MSTLPSESKATLPSNVVQATAPKPVAVAPQENNPAPLATPDLICRMLRADKNVSDLIMSPGRPPQVEAAGELVPVPNLPALTPTDTARIAGDLLGRNKHAIECLNNDGAADLSYSIAKVGRFRVNIFRQRGTYAIVMRVIPPTVPTFAELKLPAQLAEIARLKNGIVLVTGPTGSGKSSTLAAIVDLINRERACHIITIEDPIEFIHPHRKATIHQRELHSDTRTFALALRAALRQAPKVVLVGEMRDKETIEIAMTAAETGHLVLSTLHTIDASKTIERIVGEFDLSEQQAIRSRLAQSFRYIVSQRLLPRKDGQGRVAAIEILKATLRTREYVVKGEGEGRSLLDAIRDGDTEGMQDFDTVIEGLVRQGVVALETGLAYATNAGNLQLALADFSEEELVVAG
ncbi:MAG: type IV pilus twitching motility protein PilT [Terriglobales bacterium]